MIIQLRIIDKSAPLFLVCFKRKDSSQDHCGYSSLDYNKVKNLKLNQLNKFKKRPRDWEEIEQIIIPGCFKVEE